VIKDQLVKQAARFAADNTYKVEVTLEEVMDEYRKIYEALQNRKGKTKIKKLCRDSGI
jgi:DNA-binding FadR family transcriptional regulator